MEGATEEEVTGVFVLPFVVFEWCTVNHKSRSESRHTFLAEVAKMSSTRRLYLLHIGGTCSVHGVDEI